MSTYQHRVKALLAQRKGLHEQMKAILDGAETAKRSLTGEERATFDVLDQQLTELDQQRQMYEQRDQRDADLVAAQHRGGFSFFGDGGAQQRSELELQLRSLIGPPEHRSGPPAIVIRPDGPANFAEIRASVLQGQHRDLTKGTATAGGHTVGTSFYNRLVAHLIEVSGVLMAGPTVFQTERGDNLPIPRTTAHSTASSEIAEGAAISESDPAFNQLVLSAYKYGHLLQVSYELLEDTSIDLLDYIAMQAGRAAGNALGTRLVTGTGSSQPQGAATASTLGVTGGTAVAGAFTADNLIDLSHAVIAPYRSSPSCGWLVRDTTLGSIRKLKDSQGQYLWQPSMQVGAPDILLGKAVYTDPNVAAVGLSARSVLFGDFSTYVVRMVKQIRFERSDDYAFNADLSTFRCLIRADGGLADTSGSIKHFVGGAS